MDLSKAAAWNPEHWRRITTIDAHTGGEPLRIYLDGFPCPPGESILERRRNCLQRFDELRTATMWEPRGHADMYGCLVTPPERPDSDFGVLFTHNEGYSSMCGHGIIAVVTVLLQTGVLEARDGSCALRIDSPAGLILAWTHVESGRVSSVRFHNVPSFVLALDHSIEVPDLGAITFDLAFGGAFYAFVDAAQLELDTGAGNVAAMTDAGRRIKQAVAASGRVKHPFDDDLSFLYGTIFCDQARQPDADTRNVCIFADGEVDRSPTGTGVSARLAIAHARGEMSVGDTRVYESVIGSQFRGRVIETLEYGPHPAIIPEIEGSAHISGRHEFLLDPDDPLAAGFLLR